MSQSWKRSLLRSWPPSPRPSPATWGSFKIFIYISIFLLAVHFQIFYCFLVALVLISLRGPCRTVNSAWIVLKRETDALAKAHSDFADRLSADCDNILKNYINDTKKARGDIVKNGQ